MLIELWRKVVATDYTSTNCAVCGNDFDRGSVFPVAFTDDGYELGEMCTLCLDYLNRRKQDADDPTLGNWPARDWPSLEILQESRRCYPEAMYASRDEVKALSWEEEENVLAASILWEQKREAAARG
jgi:hypothetical protein